MMKFKYLILLFLILGCFISEFASTAWSAKRSSSEIKVLLQDEENELKILKQKIAGQEKLIFLTGKKEGQLLGKLKILNNKIKLKERELRIYQWNLLINKKKLAKLGNSLKQTRKNLEVQKISLGKRFRQIYKEGSIFPLKIAFSSKNVSDVLQRLKYMELVAEYDAKLMTSVNNQLENLSSEKKTLRVVRAKLARLEKDALNKYFEFEKSRNKKNIFLKKIKKKKKLGLQTRKELLRASKNLNVLIAKIAKKLASGAGLDISDQKGRLSLPLKGKILNKFGKEKDKQFGTFIINNGIDIRSKRGMSVRSVFDGKVLYTGELEGYGKMVIIGHGKTYHSLYGHLDFINVKLNQVVQTGDIIGISGDTGSLIGETLYFEMRKHGKPIEPIRWFKTARRK